MPVLTVHVLGDPQTQGSIAFKGMRRGKPILTHDKAGLPAWRALVTRLARAAASSQGLTGPLDEPVRVLYAFRVPRPARPRFKAAATKPDLDKLARAVSDSLEDAGVLAQDSRIVRMDLAKDYATEEHPAGVSIMVEWGDL